MSTSAQQAFDFIAKAFDTGRSVTVSTMTKATRFKPKHRAMFKIGKDGSLLMQRGKAWVCIALPSKVLVVLSAE